MYEITERPAAEPGAVDGFQHVCPVCGMVLTHVFADALRFDAGIHAAYHAERDLEGRVS